MFANDMDRGRLGALITHFFYKSHLHTLVQFIEIRFDNAVSMKVDLSPVGRFDSPVVHLRIHRCDATMGRCFMSFHLAATFACIVLELSARRVESIPNGNIHVLVSMMLIRPAAYDQFTIRRRDIYSYVEEIAFVVMECPTLTSP